MKQQMSGRVVRSWGMTLALFGVLVTVPLAGCSAGGHMMPTAAAQDDTSTVTRATQIPSDGMLMVAPVVYPLSSLADALANRTGTTPAGAKVTIVRSNKTVTVTVDYGTTPVTTAGGRHSVSGAFVMTVDLNARTGSLILNNVTVDGKGISGTVALSKIAISSTNVTFSVQVDLTVTKYGHITGSLTYTKVPGTKGFGIPSGQLTLVPTSGTSYGVVLNGLLLDPVTYKNLVPTAGTTTVTYSEVVKGRTVTVSEVITYNSQSPVNGQVTISINGGTPYTTTLPGF